MFRLHLGVDYGTSASKLVVRYFEAPGGERAFLLEPRGSFRIPSGVSFDNREIVFNSGCDEALLSLKMRYAGEVTGDMDRHFYGTLAPIPYGFSAGDLVTLTVWKLISIGHLAAVRILKSEGFKLGMTLGAPMSFLDNEELRPAFLMVARTAYQMYREFGPISPDTIKADLAKELLQLARTTVKEKPEIPVEKIRHWIRSETEASMYWSFKSPATAAGPFFAVDVGAGTTDSSAFLVNEEHRDEQWRKNAMCFLGACSSPYGMDAVTRLQPGQAQHGFNTVRQVAVKAGRYAYALIRDNYYSVGQWSNARLIVLGGGSLNEELCMILKKHPMNNFGNAQLKRVDLSVPSDLIRENGSSAKREDVAFTSVAYGLAQIAEAVPVAARPTEVQPVRQHSVGSFPSHEDIYGD